MTIESGITPKTERYERSSLVTKTEDLFKVVKPNEFVTNPMNLRFGALGYNAQKYDISVSGYYDVFSIDGNNCSGFWNAYLKTHHVMNVFDNVATGSLVEKKRVKYSTLKQIYLSVPVNMEEKNKISKFMIFIDHLITLHQSKSFVHILEVIVSCNLSWEQRKLSEIALRVSNLRLSSSDLPCVEYEDVVSEAGILNNDIQSKEVVKAGILFDDTHVLYGKLRPYLHNWLCPDFSGVAVGDWWVLKPCYVAREFIYRIIQTKRFDNSTNQSSGSKMPRADWNLVSNTEFMISSDSSEQEKIGLYFKKLDHLITLHQLEPFKLIFKAIAYRIIDYAKSKPPRCRKYTGLVAFIKYHI